MSIRAGTKQELGLSGKERSRQKGEGPRSWQQRAVSLLQLHSWRKGFKKGQSKETSSKVLKVVVGTC